MTYSTFPYLYDMATSIHGMPRELTVAFVKNDPDFRDYLPKWGMPVSEWQDTYLISRGIFSVFNTSDFKLTDKELEQRLNLVYNALPFINRNGGLEGREPFVDYWFPKVKDKVLNDDGYFSGDSDEVFVMNNLLRMYRQLPLWVSKTSSVLV